VGSPEPAHVHYRAVLTENGLHIIGPLGGYSTINEDLPTLCDPTDEPRDTDVEIGLLIRLIQELDRDIEGGWEGAVTAACDPGN